MVAAHEQIKAREPSRFAKIAAKTLAGLPRLKRWAQRLPRPSLRRGDASLPTALSAGLKEFIARYTPKRLYARALIIIIAPIVLLESVLAYVFMEEHWRKVTERLSQATARDVAALIEVYKNYPDDAEHTKLFELARDQLRLGLSVHPPGDLPAALPKPFFAPLDEPLQKAIRKQLQGKPFWIDTVGDLHHVVIRVQLVDDANLHFTAERKHTYPSKSYVFLFWMVGTSIILLTVAIMFLRNQIRPILRLSEAAEAFGKGQPVPEGFRPGGALEVRQAATAFNEMRHRISTHVEQRTIMLAGVSHDLRTVLTRFKLELEFLKGSPEAEALNADVKEMEHMLEDYLAFAKGDGGEQAAPANMRDLLEEIYEDSYHFGAAIELKMPKRIKDLVLTLKRQAFKRALTNLISNAARFGDKITISAAIDKDWLRVAVEDDGPGIAREDLEDVFKPFHRLDHARNQDEGNTGLGLAIARDVARLHGGDVDLDASPDLGGLRATVRVPR